MFDVTFGRGKPFTLILCGPSGSGKTEWIKNFLYHRDVVLHERPAKVFLFYTHLQPIYNTLLRDGYVHQLIEGVPSYEELKELVTPYKSAPGGSLCIFDDPMSTLGHGESARVFTELSHHTRSSVIWVSQTLYAESAEFRRMSLNSHYLVLMKNPRNARIVITLSSQIAPYKNSYIVQSYQAATSQPYGYLLLDFEQGQSDAVRMRGSIFKHEKPMTVYMEKSSKMRSSRTLRVNSRGMNMRGMDI